MPASDLFRSSLFAEHFLLPLNTCPCHSACRQIPIYHIPTHSGICVIFSSPVSCQIWTQRTPTSFRVSIWGVHQGECKIWLGSFWIVKHTDLDLWAHLVGHYPQRQVAWTRFLHVPASWKRDGFTATWHNFFYPNILLSSRRWATGLAKMKVSRLEEKTWKECIVPTQ